MIRVRIILHKDLNAMNTSENYEHRLLHALRRITRAVDIYSRKLNSEFGLTTPQMLCLDMLAKSNSMILKDLAKMVNLGESTVNGIIDRLEAKNYVERIRSVDDRRKVYLKVTDEGLKTIQGTPFILQDKLSASLSSLADHEQRSMTESLERVAELMEAERWMHQ